MALIAKQILAKKPQLLQLPVGQEPLQPLAAQVILQPLAAQALQQQRPAARRSEN